MANLSSVQKAPAIEIEENSAEQYLDEKNSMSQPDDDQNI